MRTSATLSILFAGKSVPLLIQFVTTTSGPSSTPSVIEELIVVALIVSEKDCRACSFTIASAPLICVAKLACNLYDCYRTYKYVGNDRFHSLYSKIRSRASSKYRDYQLVDMIQSEYYTVFAEVSIFGVQVDDTCCVSGSVRGY